MHWTLAIKRTITMLAQETVISDRSSNLSKLHTNLVTCQSVNGPRLHSECSSENGSFRWRHRWEGFPHFLVFDSTKFKLQTEKRNQSHARLLCASSLWSDWCAACDTNYDACLFSAFNYDHYYGINGGHFDSGTGNNEKTIGNETI